MTKAVNDSRLQVLAVYVFQKQDGNTALIYAALNGHSDFVRLLVDGGADKEAKCTVRYFAHFSSCILCFRLSVLFC